MNKSGDFMEGLIVGGLIGAVIGILYAPKSGRETREEISQKADELLAKVKEEYENAAEKSRKAYEATVKRLKALEQAKDVSEKVDELAGRGKGTLQEGKSRVKKAIEAGVDSFKEEQGKAVQP
jgi:gas vesicle protein